MEQEPKRKAWPGLIAGGVAACLALSLLWTGGARAVETSAPALLEVPRQTAGQPVEDEVGDMVIPLGKAVGIKLFSDGVLVVGLSPVETRSGTLSPGRSCGLKEGDVITHMDGSEVDTIEEVQDHLAQHPGEKMTLQVQRGEESLQLSAQAVKTTAGAYQLGVWLRDSMAGIGTMTFYDPDSGVFAALGHGINDVDTAKLMPLETGSIMGATVSDVKKGAAGEPGELHGDFDLTVRCQGDTQVDGHHTVEDTGICLGRAFAEALGDKRGITRYGQFLLPMDETLVLCACDLSGRDYLGWAVDLPAQKVGDFDTELAREFWLAFVRECPMALHIRLLAGENTHHILEAVFKGAGRALKMAAAVDEKHRDESPSTKGVL